MLLMTRCRALRPMLTLYVDRQLTDDDRQAVERHLDICTVCRRRADREAAIKHLLHERAADVRTMLPLPVVPAVRPSRWAAGPMRLGAAAALVLAVGGFGAMYLSVFGTVPLIATGWITDTKCVHGHGHLGPNQTMAGADCVRKCVEGGARYVFVTDRAVYQIRNQDFAGLQPAAEERVQVRGELSGDVLSVVSIAPVTELSRLSFTGFR
jgi:hypothetical protein